MVGICVVVGLLNSLKVFSGFMFNIFLPSNPQGVLRSKLSAVQGSRTLEFMKWAALNMLCDNADSTDTTCSVFTEFF